MKPLAPVIVSLFLAACSSGVASPVPFPSSKLTPPSPELMAKVEPLKDMKEGDSIYDHAAVCRAAYGELATTVTRLQHWVVIVTKPKRN